MSDNINFDYKNLSPFKWFVLENFPFIEADFDALTEWQLFSKIGKEINKIIDSQNIVGEQAETLTNAFNNLKNYVDNYFNNLDVQDEINNKLNEMAETGELQQIIETYLQANTSIIFNNVNDMKQSTLLKNGTFAQTLGFYNINDGGASLYRIVEDNNINIDNAFVIELNNGLKAILIHSNYIEVEKLGFKADVTFDCGTHFENIMNKNNTLENPVNLLFGNKTYYFSETLIYNNLKFNLFGKSNNLGNYERHTVFKPYKANQRFVLKIGGTKEFTTPENWHTYWKTNLIIEGITFSDDNYHLLDPNSPNQEKYGLLCIEYFSGLILDISFTNTFSRCLYEKNVWEVRYKWLSFRNCNYPVKSSAIYFDNVLNDGYSNTTAHFFEFIDIEQINGTFLRTGTNCNMQNIIIDNLSIENGSRANEGILGRSVALIETEAEYLECIPFGLLEINSPIYGLQINQLNLHNFGNSYYYIDDANTKGVDVLLKLEHNYEININSINFNLCGAFQQIYGTGNLDKYIESILTINAMTYSPRAVPQSSPKQANGNMLGYFYNNITGGIINIMQTNMDIRKDTTTVLKPQLYNNLKLKEISVNNYGRLRFGNTQNSEIGIKGQFLGETITKRFIINYPCKVTFGLLPIALTSSGDHVVGCYYRGSDGSYGGRLIAGIGESDLNKNITKSINITQDIINTYDRIEFIINGISNYELDYINIIPT